MNESASGWLGLAAVDRPLANRPPAPSNISLMWLGRKWSVVTLDAGDAASPSQH